MKSDPARLRMLTRLRRVRIIEQKQALTSLSEAQSARDRMTDLANRSRELAAQYGAANEILHGGDLTTNQHFRSHLGALAQSAREMESDSSQQVDRTASLLALADRKLDHLATHISEEESRKAATRTARENTHVTKLARRLQNHSQELAEYESGKLR